MGGTLSQLDWAGLALALVAYFYDLGLAARWTETASRMKYEGWRHRLNSWIAFPGWIWQPLLFVIQGLAASAIFLYWRNSFPVDKRMNRDAILGLSIVNVFVLKLWTPLLLWGPTYWWAAALDSFLVLGTSTAVVALMGVEGAWLPFGLYIIYPVFALIVMGLTLFFWWNSTDLANGMTNMRARLMRAGNRMTPSGFELKTQACHGKYRPVPRQPNHVPRSGEYYN